MRLDRVQTRVRSDAELAFIVMRALASARLLWARGGALPLDALASLVVAEPHEIAMAVNLLCDEGMAEVANSDGTVRLTERAAREIASQRGGLGRVPS